MGVLRIPALRAHLRARRGKWKLGELERVSVQQEATAHEGLQGQAQTE